MTEHDEFEDQPEPPKRRGWRRFFLRGLLVVGILGFLALLARFQVGRLGQRQLDRMTAHLDATDPGWRLDDIERARAQAAPSDDKNPSNIVIAHHKSIPTEWKDHLSTRNWEWGPITNYQPSFFELAWLVGGERITADFRQSLRHQLLRPDILACPNGHYVVIQNENPIMTLLPNIQNSREVVTLLDYDARLSIYGGNANQGIGSSRAILVVSRSIGDEPYLISQLVRFACDRIAVQSALQVLALSKPTEGLAELQKELRSEADVPWLQYGIRGERGSFNKLFDGLRAGKITLTDIEGMSSQKSGMLKSVAMHAYLAFLPGDQAKLLEMLTAYLEASKLPAHEQKAAFAQIKLPPRPPDDFRYILTNTLLPAIVKVAEASWRTRADLLTGSVAIACERFRIANNRWPQTLEEIPKDILPDIPLDPFNGKPIQYQKLEDGVAVFTIGNEQDAEKRASNERLLASNADATNRTAQNNANDEMNDPLIKLGRGWRLWDPKFRKLPHPLKPPDLMNQ